MTEKEALAVGFTHHGKMFGVPVWIADPFRPCPMIEPKIAIFGFWIDLCTYAVQFANAHGADWDFPMCVGASIGTGEAKS